MEIIDRQTNIMKGADRLLMGLKSPNPSSAPIGAPVRKKLEQVIKACQQELKILKPLQWIMLDDVSDLGDEEEIAELRRLAESMTTEEAETFTSC